MPVTLTDIGVGTTPNDKTGDPARTGGLAINANNATLEAAVADKVDAETISGLWSFSHASGIQTNTISERTAAAGVTIDGALIKDNTITTTQVYAKSGSSGAAAGTDEVVIESATNAVLQFLSPNTNGAYIDFGDPEGSNPGRIIYTHTDNTLSFNTSSATRLALSSTAADFQATPITTTGNGTFGNQITVTGASTSGSVGNIVMGFDDTRLRLSGGTSYNVGANIRLFGSTHATQANAVQFAASATTTLQYNGTNTWDFQANAITTTGALTCGTFTSTGIDDNATAERLQLEDDQFVFRSSDKNWRIINGDGDGLATISGGSARNSGANILLYGATHATLANDIVFRENGTSIATFDSSGNLWDFADNAITTTGGITGNTLTGTLQTAAQGNVTSLGTLTSLTVDNTTLNSDILTFNNAIQTKIQFYTNYGMGINSSDLALWAATSGKMSFREASGSGFEKARIYVTNTSATSLELRGEGSGNQLDMYNAYSTGGYNFIGMYSSRGTIASPSNLAASDMIGEVGYVARLEGAWYTAAGMMAWVTTTSATNRGDTYLYTYAGNGTDRSPVTSLVYDSTQTAPTFRLENSTVFAIKERATAPVGRATYGTLWVKNTTPCQLWFTDDASTDTQIV